MTQVPIGKVLGKGLRIPCVKTSMNPHGINIWINARRQKQTSKDTCMSKINKYAKDATNRMRIVHDGIKQARQATQKETKHVITLKDKS